MCCRRIPIVNKVYYINRLKIHTWIIDLWHYLCPKSNTMATALEVADVFLKLSQPEAGDTISNLKLQKLLYYVQGYHLAFYGSELFPDPIVAWQYGPVVEGVYHNFKRFGYGP